MSSPCREEVYNKNYSDLPLGLSGHRIVCDWDDNGFYVVGGWNKFYDSDQPEDSTDNHYVRQVWKYNVSNKNWTKLKSENPPVSLASHTLTKLESKHLLMYGGSLSSRNVLGNSNETYLYNVKNESWQKLETTGDPCQVNCGHWFGQAMQKADDNIFVSTGIVSWNDNDGLKVHKLNLRNMIWEDLSNESNQPEGRVRHEFLVYESKIMVFGGGRNFIYQSFPLNILPCFDIRSRTWSTLMTVPDPVNGFPKPRTCHSLVVYGDYAYVTGGYSEEATEENADWTVVQHWNDIWRLHLPTLRWSLLSCKLPLPLWFHAADVNAEGQMYVFGGCTDLEYEVRTNKTFRVTLDSQIPCLENVCWETVSKYCRSTNLNIYSDEYLINKVGLNKKYLSKLRW